ncbi:hypothetical protein TD95_000642 [Thielaviopsis punctulata]|uniref:Homeobox domain-containing protein n=1 Tax=Thielaviopsis punctulata TaxID=72032 RepID=A0A0F4ZKR6_9PEZI|nr:hypothetical protein TD95_000642 [Thielaviopsis punctulata]
MSTMTPKKALCVVTVEPDKQTKNRRKRTQAGDKAILEAAYQANAKPDKSARLAIVRQVSMTEKEVQIWFQNRRQNDRRKSRPLSAQEIAALRYGGMQVISSASASPETRNALQAACLGTPGPVPRSQNSYHNVVPQTIPSPTQSAFPVQTPTHHMGPSHMGSGSNPSPMPSLVDSSPGGVRGAMGPIAAGMRVANITSSPENEIRTPSDSTNSRNPMIHGFHGSVGYVSNRWNMNNSLNSPSGHGMLEDPKPIIPQGSRILPEPMSKVRLGYSLDGRAEITNDLSPHRLRSPDHSAILPELSHKIVDHGNSDAASVTLPPISALTGSLPPGRSRDVRQWEFCCDKEAPQDDQLTKIAASEAAGSALAEISLRRSTSGFSAHYAPPMNHGTASYQASAIKRNLMISPAPYMSHAKPMGRMVPESDYATSPRSENGSVKVPVAMLVTDRTATGSTVDSDKESWTAECRRPIAPQRVLTPESPMTRRSPSPASRQQAEMKSESLHKKRSREVEECEGDESARKRMTREEDVSRFISDVSPSKKGDAVCVAGLLALSQGNWR